MEKRTPHCKLAVVHALVQQRKVRITASAQTGAAAMGLDTEGVIAVIMALIRKDFYKSMTTLHDHRIWQDVYRPATAVGDVYLKLTVVEDVLIVSFKGL